MVRMSTQPLVGLRPGSRVCAADAVVEKGRGVRFQIERDGNLEAAFAIRYAGQVSAFLNRCAHRGLELDWQEGEFFDTEQQFLVCATHDARYDPATGVCVSGPCRGAKLISLPVREVNGWIWLAVASV